jgi:hypothetical protein
MRCQFLASANYACRCAECVPALGIAERVTGQIAARVIRAGAKVARFERRVRAAVYRVHRHVMLMSTGLVDDCGGDS